MVQSSFRRHVVHAPSQEGGSAAAPDPALEATNIEQVKSRLIPVSLKHFKDDRGFGFLLDMKGREYFAHVSALRIADKDGRLQRADGMAITDAGFGQNPDLYCIPGPGQKEGQLAAIIWIGTVVAE